MKTKTCVFDGKSLFVCLFAALVALAGCPGKKETRVDERAEREAAQRCADPFALPPSGEGMWPWADLDKLDEEELRSRGLELSLKEIWTPGKGGLARAVVGLRGCTASFVSPDGLVMTNHHCVFRAIQRNSTKERNFLEEGILAQSRDDELNGYGVRVLVFRNQKDVTEEITRDLEDKNLSDIELMTAIEEREKSLVAECEKKPNTRCLVSRENDGIRFLLLENMEITDVRLVAAPPSSMGGYGGDVDNWHWPRHSLDFALLRAYVGPDGKPREFHEENVPYKPERFLRISRDGLNEGDFVMVMGRPYHTDRYLSAPALKDSIEWFYPIRLKLMEQWVAVLENTAREEPDAAIPTISMIKALQNWLKNARGMIDGARERNLLELKETEESRWRAWVEANPGLKEKWGSTLDELSAFRKKTRENRMQTFLMRFMKRGVNTLAFARVLTKWAEEKEKPDLERAAGYQDRDREDRVSWLENAQRSFHLEADKRVLTMFIEWFGRLPDEERPAVFEKALKGDYEKENIRRYVDRLYSESRLYELDYRIELFGKSQDRLKNKGDAMLDLAFDLKPVWDAVEQRTKRIRGGLFRLRRPYLESLIQFRGKLFYPDANASPRVSFAHVAGYFPRDGEWHMPFTTLSGLAAKDTGEEPFNAPEEVLDKIKTAHKTRYADSSLGESGDVVACFLSNADTTGGNSGSPVLNGRGEFVGLNFDRVYANITGDFGYSRERSRNIMVDARYILWYLDEVAGAREILKELFPED